MKPACNGEGWGEDHCCYLGGRRCDYLLENVAGRRYACGLLITYGSWEAMNRSPEYRKVGEWWTRNGNLPWNYCETFDPAFCCRPEWRKGRNTETEPVPEEYLNGDVDSTV